MSTRIPIGPLLGVGALIAGIALGEAAGPGSARPALLGGLVGVASAALITRRGVRVGIAVVALALLGSAVMQRALNGLAVSPLTAPISSRAEMTLTGTLVGDPRGTRFTARGMLRVDDAGGRRVLVRAKSDAGPRLGFLDAGERVTLRGWLEPLSGFDERHRWQHAVGTFHVFELLDARGARSLLDRLANAARRVVLRGSEPLSAVDRALLAGFLLGDTRGLPHDVVEQFRASGLTHLMAVSGSNVAFVLAVFAPILRRLGLFGRLAGGGAVLVLFGTMTRWEPSVLRAIAMASIGLLAAYVGRPTAGLRVLLLAAVALLVVDPFLLHSVGFLLSCAASLGILLLAHPVAERLRGPAWMREVVGVTAAAQVGVAPVLLPVFGSMPLASIPANLVAVPLAGPLTVWGLVAGVVGGAAHPFAPQLSSLLALPTVALLRALRAVADLASRIPVDIDGRAAVGIVAVGTFTAALRRARRFPRDARSVQDR